MDNNQIGCLAEYKFATVAMELGFYVSFPLLNTSRYDCIIETPKGLFKIQVKSVQKNRDRSRVFIRDTKNNNYKKRMSIFLQSTFKKKMDFLLLKMTALQNL